MAAFKFVIIPMGSGWPSGHVAVDEHYKWPDKPNGENICLNLDAQNHEEFCAEVDNLILELERLKKAAKLKFAAAQAKYDGTHRQKAIEN